MPPMMFSKRQDMRVTVKPFTGLPGETKRNDFDSKERIMLRIPSGSRIKKVTKTLGPSRNRTMLCFVNGDEISFFRPVAGN
jgi:hypothetical protein